MTWTLHIYDDGFQFVEVTADPWAVTVTDPESEYESEVALIRGYETITGEVEGIRDSVFRLEPDPSDVTLPPKEHLEYIQGELEKWRSYDYDLVDE